MHRVFSSINRPTRHTAQNRQRRLKLLFIVVLAALALSFALPRLMLMLHAPHNTQTSVVHQDLAHIVQGLQLYRKDNGHYPGPEQGLLALILKPTRGPSAYGWRTGGYVDRLPRDPWDASYQYRLDHEQQTWQVFSYGPAGPAAGDDSTSIILMQVPVSAR